MRDLLVLGTWIEAINARKIDQIDFTGAVDTGPSDVLLDSDAGEIGDFLTEARKAIE
jgi:hypothetical protein